MFSTKINYSGSLLCLFFIGHILIDKKQGTKTKMKHPHKRCNSKTASTMAAHLPNWCSGNQNATLKVTTNKT
jgi:hypothetical protein